MPPPFFFPPLSNRLVFPPDKDLITCKEDLESEPDSDRKKEGTTNKKSFWKATGPRCRKGTLCLTIRTAAFAFMCVCALLCRHACCFSGELRRILHLVVLVKHLGPESAPSAVGYFRGRKKISSFSIMVFLQMDSLYPLVVWHATSLKNDHWAFVHYCCIYVIIFKRFPM